MLESTLVIVRTVDGLDANLDDAHWEEHIVVGHPELRDHHERVVEALEQPDGVYGSKRDLRTRIYLKKYAQIVIAGSRIEQISLRVLVREDDGFVVTAFFVAASLRGLGERKWPS